jgi:hypothetical protein
MGVIRSRLAGGVLILLDQGLKNHKTSVEPLSGRTPGCFGNKLTIAWVQNSQSSNSRPDNLGFNLDAEALQVIDPAPLPAGYKRRFEMI